jgi:integrase
VEETERLITSISDDQNQFAAKAIMLLLLTGARRSEITQARWDYVDWQKRTLLVPISKSGKPRTVTLNAAAVALLRSIPRDPASPCLFPSRLPGLFDPWNRIRRRAGLPDVRLHDLRHSFASFLVNQGITLYVVQGLLGHSSARTTQRYAHLAPQTLLEAAEVVSGVIQAASGDEISSMSETAAAPPSL